MGNKEENLQIVMELDEGDGEVKRFDFSQKSVVIGSGHSANLKLSDSSVSSIHAIVKAGEEQNTALVSDLGSDQGTAINGKEVTREATLKVGDQLRVGEIEIDVISIGSDSVDQVAREKESTAEPAPGPQKEEPVVQKVVKTSEPVKKPVVVKQAKPAPKQTGPFKPTRSGENFFLRELHSMEKPIQKDRFLEIKIMWGPIVLDVRQFDNGKAISIGDSPEADIYLSNERLGGEVYTLASPGAGGDHQLHIRSGVEIEVRHDGKAVSTDNLPSQGGTRNYNLRIGDRARVMIGQLGFVVQYVAPARAIAGVSSGVDYGLKKWWSIVFVLALGLWLALEQTPRAEIDVSDYLKNPARFAQLIMPDKANEKKATFDEIKKKKDEKIPLEDDSKWKKIEATKVKTETKDIPKEIKKEMDRKVATNAGILGLLKAKGGGGTGDDASSVFGGSALTSLDSALSSLQSNGMGDSAGFGGLGTRGGGGGGGGGLGLGGLGTAGYGRGDGAGFGSVALGHREKHDVKIQTGRTKIIGGLSQEVVGRYIQRYWAQIKFCYEKELGKDPNMAGKVTVTFTISGNGRVAEAQTLQTTVNNATMEECILRVIRRIIFPTPKGGGEVIVTYPFVFTTT